MACFEITWKTSYKCTALVSTQINEIQISKNEVQDCIFFFRKHLRGSLDSGGLPCYNALVTLPTDGSTNVLLTY